MSLKGDNTCTEIRSAPISSYIFVIVLCVTMCVLIVTKHSPIYPVIVNGDSMESTLHDSDRGLVFTFADIDRYDIIVCNACIGGENTLIIKRVIGLPGDTVECKGHVLLVNGDPAVDFAKDPDMNTDFDKVTVPSGSYFVMGDNREVSLDSRYAEVGFISRASVTGVFHKV